PLAFEANRGQAPAEVKFLARGAGYTVFLTPSEAVLTLDRGESDRAVVRLMPVATRDGARIAGENPLPGVVTYTRGGSISAPTYASVRYAELYPGIDLVYYGHPRRLEYDFVVAPGADPGQIAIAFDGVESLRIDAGDLVLRTGAGELRQPRPVVYQDIRGTRRAVSGEYVLDGDGHVRVRLGDYDASRPLVIDPVLAYSTYLGGSDDEADLIYYGAVTGIAVDAAGNAYVTGTTRSPDFPTTQGANRTLGGDQDAFVTKLSPTGAVLYSTYVGGPCN